MQILIVDDDAIARTMLRHALSAHGHDVIEAADGDEALRRIKAEPIRMVISDWEMPRMTGVQLCDRVRASSLGRYVYFILLTSRDSSFAVEGLDAGADDFLTKPFNPEELRVRVRAGQRILGLESRDVTIFALAKLAESRDPETGAHLERVQNYCRVLAEHLATLDEYRDAVDDDFIQLIHATSPLHDIGKVAIPDFVLLKPGRLSPREFDIMKTHASAGAATLDAALKRNPDARFLKFARDICAYHHERWDGEGYPHGLAGEQIPLSARIMAVADVYDALVSKRAYKDAFSHDVARAMIIEESGAHFDPALVEAFLACEQQFIEIHDRFTQIENTMNVA